jgi:hypothetical protein
MKGVHTTTHQLSLIPVVLACQVKSARWEDRPVKEEECSKYDKVKPFASTPAS